MKTFNEWSSLGYKVKKGSKATWVDGVAMFSKAQVQKYHKKTSFISEPNGGGGWPEEDYGYGCGVGADWGI